MSTDFSNILVINSEDRNKYLYPNSNNFVIYNIYYIYIYYIYYMSKRKLYISLKSVNKSSQKKY